MKLTDYVAGFLAAQGVRHAFVLTGGAACHLIDSIARHPDIDYICTQHEQAAAMAADAYSRVTGNLGAAIATSGPGATNLLTGVCCAYYDSVPVIYLTGQVATFRLKGDLGVRQIGFQETGTVDIYKSVTKYSVLVDDPGRVRYELEKAAYLARSGRPGPVLIDLPDDLQRSDVNVNELESFVPPPENKNTQLHKQVDRCLELLEKARRPVVILGWGIQVAKAQKEAAELVNRLGLPFLPTWSAMHLIPSDNPLFAGSFGLHGTRYGNFTVQNADLVLSIGSRLDTHNTGSPITTFAREAKKVIVDIDDCELNKYKKYGVDADVLIHCDAREFLRAIISKLDGFKKPDISEWKRKVVEWQTRYPICPPQYYEQELVNPYVFVRTLAKESSKGDVIFADTGCGVAWMMQAFQFKENQRLFSAFNNTPMGYALPASIGACIALDKKPITCITGDGGLQINLHELATVLRHDLPIKIFLLNNHGYSMIRQTQIVWFESRYEACSTESGLAFPDFEKVAEAYGYKCVTISRNRELPEKIRAVLDMEGPVFCNVEIPENLGIIPQARFGRPIEDQEPFLDREEFLENMIVKPVDASLR